MKFPETGTAKSDVLDQMSELSRADADWRGGRTFGYIYNAGDEVNALVEEAMHRFLHTNALSLTAFPSLRRFEAEILAMAADLLHGPEAAGSVTTGGTESILMAVKTAREWARRKHPGVRDFEMVVPVSAHPAFEKAANYFDVKAIRTPMRPDFRADVAAMRAAINERTILLVGSAPSFPQGVVDPIPEIAALAGDRGLLCHVDACLGGYLLPFAERLGRPVVPFDFRVPGDTSISADLHKYGYASKGASTVLYRDRELRKLQYFVYVDWPGGIYASPSMTGARGGAPLAAAWAVLRHLGAEGFMRLAGEALDAAGRLMAGVREVPGLRILGEPDMTVFSFTSDTLNVYALGEEMERRGWIIDRQQRPQSLHMMVSPRHKDIVEPFLVDLRASAEAVRGLPPPDTGTAAVYGMLATLPDREVVADAVLGFMDGWDRL